MPLFEEKMARLVPQSRKYGIVYRHEKYGCVLVFAEMNDTINENPTSEHTKTIHVGRHAYKRTRSHEHNVRPRKNGP